MARAGDYPASRADRTIQTILNHKEILHNEVR